MAEGLAYSTAAWRRWVDHAAGSVWDFVFPPRCGACGLLLEGSRGIAVCDACAGAMRRVPEPGCAQCGGPFPDSASGGHRCMKCLKNPPAFDRARSVFVYEGPVQTAILRFKFHGMSGLRGFFAESLMADRALFAAASRTRDYDVVVPVPLHPFKMIVRGYNQTALLAEEISRTTGVPVDRFGLRKVKRTPPQSTLPREKRARSLRGAFRADPGRFSGRRVLIVDDVMTTGATLSECARALKAAGAARVEAITVARAL